MLNLVYFYQDAGLFNTAIKSRQERATKLGIQIQPYIIVLGPTADVAQASYVIVNDTKWKLRSVLQAVDVCFKTCFALNCNFAAEALHLWMLIQNYLYDISIENDVCIPSVVTLLQKLASVCLE